MGMSIWTSLNWFYVFKVLELLLMGWPGEAAALLQESLLRVLALALSGRETSLVVAGVCAMMLLLTVHSHV
jgi:hypothetical protein